MSEDDIRTKVIYTWLKDCGILDSDIKIEYSINLRLGKGTKTIHSRSDVLVRTSDKNLLMIEVKTPDHILHENDKGQVLSYARSLTDGIAPYSVLTNWKESLIFDSVTGTEISNTTVPKNHPYIINDFKVNSDSIAHKAEALNYLISMNFENLLIFCSAQVQDRMRLLKGNDIQSGKKYIPDLYTDRMVAKDELYSKLFSLEKSTPMILLAGPPQHGKTSFLCNTAEQFVSENIPCLFYPAISLRNGLLQAIQEDFQWGFSQNYTQHHLCAKLQQLCELSQHGLVIFIDGWNEMTNQAFLLNDEIQRICSEKIKIVLSTTSPSLKRLLFDEANNLGYVGESVKLSENQIRKLTSEKLKNTKDINVIQIGKFNYSEMQIAKDKYQKAFNVSFHPLSNLPEDPFYLRLASEQYSGSEVPAFATRTELIRNSLIKKGARSNIHQLDLFRVLNQFSEVIAIHDAPFDIHLLPAFISSQNVLSSWTECAILIQLHKENWPQIDFYYSHDRDFSIAILFNKWHELITKKSSAADIKKIISNAITTEAGKSALRWFLSCPDYCENLEIIFTKIEFGELSKGDLHTILGESVLTQVNLNNTLTFDWLANHVELLIAAETLGNLRNSELLVMLYALAKSIDRDSENEKYEFWMRALVLYDNSYEDTGIEESFVCSIYGEEDLKIYPDYEGISDFDFPLFEKFLLDENQVIATRAGLYLAYLDPYGFLDSFASFKFELEKLKRDSKSILTPACEKIYDEICESYYGSFCPGWLSESEIGDESVKDEYLKMKKAFPPILELFAGSELGFRFLRILENLKKISGLENSEREGNENHLSNDPNQFRLDV